MGLEGSAMALRLPTTEGTGIALDETVDRGFASKLCGDLLLPHNTGYDEACSGLLVKMVHDGG